MKDCVVIESYLDIVSSLRTAGLTSKIVFVSSNTRDYAGETGRALKADFSRGILHYQNGVRAEFGSRKVFPGSLDII